MRTMRLLAAVTALLVLAGCADSAEDTGPEPTPAPVEVDATPEADADVTPPPGIDVPADPETGEGAPGAEGDDEVGAEPEGAAESQGDGLAAQEQWDLRLAGPEGEEVAFTVEVVADPPSRQQGLMHRTELAADAGMLFLFPGEHRGGFWMKNTLIPLSIAYIGPDEEILAILDMEPCEADPCPSYDPGVPYTAALEVNQGAFDDVGVTTGWRAELPADLPAPS